MKKGDVKCYISRCLPYQHNSSNEKGTRKNVILLLITTIITTKVTYLELQICVIYVAEIVVVLVFISSKIIALLVLLLLDEK